MTLEYNESMKRWTLLLSEDDAKQLLASISTQVAYKEVPPLAGLVSVGVEDAPEEQKHRGVLFVKVLSTSTIEAPTLCDAGGCTCAS
jgi:hypothetical protein